MMEDEQVLLELETADEQIFGHEFSVRDRCQQIGISLDNVRYRVGADRFKWLALMAMLKLRKDNDLFDDVSIDTFFERVVSKLPDVEHKNPLACVLIYYASISEKIQFQLDETKLNYIQKEVFPAQEFLFQNHGVRLSDLVRYIRLFQSTFSP
jgi:hypothetical protein